MKRLPEGSVYETVSGAVLFRDDIEDIIGILKARSLKVSFNDSMYQYDSIDEIISQKGHRPSNLRITGEIDHRSITIDFAKREANVHSYGSTELRSLGFEILTILRSKVPWHYRVLNPWFWGVPGYMLILFGSSFKRSISLLPEWFPWFVIVVGVTWGLSINLRQFAYGLILRRIHEGGFWRRNSEKIILLFLGSLIGALFTVLIQRILTP